MGFWNKLFGKKEESFDPQYQKIEIRFPENPEMEFDNSREPSFLEQQTSEVISELQSANPGLTNEYDAQDSTGGVGSDSLNNESSGEPSVTSVGNEPDSSSAIPTPSSVNETLGNSEEAVSASINQEVGSSAGTDGARSHSEEDIHGEASQEDQDEEDDEDVENLEELIEDLTNLNGGVLPQLSVPDWRAELEFAKGRYEPCDLADHIVRVSKRRLTVKRIDQLLAQNRLVTYKRFLERAERRFQDRQNEDAILRDALIDIEQWESEQSKSVAWRFVKRVNEEVNKATQVKEDATRFVEENKVFSNPQAIDVYREFNKRVFAIPVIALYVSSVLCLTYNRFEWIVKHLPFFNLGIRNSVVMVSGIAAGFWLANIWKYGKNVGKTQRNLLAFNKKYQDQYARIQHAVKEHTRLVNQQPRIEPTLRVLAKGYRVQGQSDTDTKAKVTTEFDPNTLPACVTLARAVVNDEDKMARLKRRALSVLMSAGWRTDGLNRIARIHADSQMLDPNAMSLASLDTDSVVSSGNAQKTLMEAFSNTKIHERVSRERLRKAILDLHKEVLAKWQSDSRPRVISLRDDGYDKVAFRTTWLDDEDVTLDWISFLTEILSQETAPFSTFNIYDKRSELNMAERISSIAVVPNYFDIPDDEKLKIGKSPASEVTPIDAVVRVDVSPWASPSAFTVFSSGAKVIEESEDDEGENLGGGTSV